MVKEIDDLPGNICGFFLSGSITSKDYDDINAVLEKQKQEHENIRLLVEMVEIEEVTPKAFMEDFKTAIKHYQSVEKMAVMAADSWIKVAIKASDFLTPDLELEFFTLNEKEKAIRWLK